MFLHESTQQWQEPPGHINAFSKYLVGPDQGSRFFDFRISRYPAGGYVQEHVHDDAEHVYYFSRGQGVARCGDQTERVGAGSVMFVPAGVTHSVRSEGPDDLEFVIVTSPPSIPR